MIVAERKPLSQIAEIMAPYKRICVLGCGSCVTVCLAGGQKEALETATALSIQRQNTGGTLETEAFTIERQCEYEYVDEVAERLKGYDAVLSLACGVGVQTIASRLPEIIVLPGLNTHFMGYPLEQGVWIENCLGCGDCVLHLTQGICPITRCSKSILNGPCGGSQDGKCEISKDLDCAWHLIHERLQKLNMVSTLQEIQPPKNWATSHHGGPRTIVREDVRIDNGE